jgi:hypothetical protein
MTTQVPYDVAAPPPEPQYPTAPPWATPPLPIAAAEPVAPAYGGGIPHGQLLVPYPEEMHRAGRAKPPALWPIPPLTFLFAVPGLISTVRRAGRAQRAHRSAAPYWIAFVVSLAASFLLWSMIFAVGFAVLLNVRETAVTKTLQENLVKDGQLKAAWNLTATAARCEPAGSRTDDLRRYDCLLTLADGRTGSLSVTADSDGNWTAVTTAAPAKKKKGA